MEQNIGESGRINFRDNCFNLIRLLAALQVAYGHMIEHFNLNIPEIITDVFWFFRGVPIFFALSGYLIWNSIGRSKTFTQYAQKRFWRIFPELWGGVIIELAVLIILYFDGIEWLSFGLFAIGQSTIFQFWTPDCLRGYGVGTPNGSLGTIGELIQLYIVAWFIYKILHGKSLRLYFTAFFVSLAVSISSRYVEKFIPEILVKLYHQTFIPYLWIFLLGIIFAEFFDILIPIAKKYWWLFTATTYLFIFIDVDIQASYPVFMHIFQIFAVMGIAYSFPKLEIKTDISYGLYIYHMTVVNVMVNFGLLSRIEYLFIALIISCAMAYLSTITIGRMSINKKKLLAI